jgi:glycerol-3-phosphate acyltransferase PlsY
MMYLIPILSYLIGSIPFGLLIGKFFYKIDVRTVGSGNIGATNVSRTCSKLAGLLTFLLDFYKGIVAKDINKMSNDLTLAKNRFEPSKINQLQILVTVLCLSLIRH